MDDAYTRLKYIKKFNPNKGKDQGDLVDEVGLED